MALALLSCPTCHQLTYSKELKELAQKAEAAAQINQHSEELALWREALDLLPPTARQYQIIREKVERLSVKVDQQSSAFPTSSPTEKTNWKKWPMGLGILALFLWKFKAILALILTKGKLLLLGLTKASTFFSMILSFGVYWSQWGWMLGLGLVLSIYIHEMGHIAMLRKFGIKATAPMFIPGLGALIRLKQYPATAIEEARVGLAGPFWGFGAALGCYALYQFTDESFFMALARLGAWINLFNLIPIWQLDGAHAFKALSKSQRWFAGILTFITFAFFHDGLLLILGFCILFRCFESSAPSRGDTRTLMEFSFLIIVLSLLTKIPDAQ